MSTNFRYIDFPGNTLAPGAKCQTLPNRHGHAPETSARPPRRRLLAFNLLLAYLVDHVNKHAAFVASFAFNLLLAYLVDHVDKHSAFVASSAASIAPAVSYLRLAPGARFVFREAARGQFVYLELFSCAFFFTGIAVTTLFILKTAVHPRQPRLAPMFTPPLAVLRTHPLGEARSSCAAQ